MLFDLTALSATQLHWSSELVDLASNILLVTGAVMQVRGFLLPAMVFGVMANVALWMFAAITLFGSTIVLTLLAGNEVEHAATALCVIFTIGFVLAAIVHLLIIRNIFQLYSELAEEQQRGLFQTTTTTFVLLPGATVNPSAIIDSKFPYGQV